MSEAQRPDIFYTPEAYCAVCGKPLNATGPVYPDAIPGGADGPEPGSLTVCMGCGAVLIYRQDMHLRLLTVEEWQGLRADAAAWAAVQQILAERASGAWRQRLPGTS
jgi:hypothetical protein